MDEALSRSDHSFLHIKKWQTMNRGLIAGFTTRKGGVSTPPFQSLNLGLHVPDDKNLVITNREILASKLGIPLNKWVSGEQTHHTSVKIIGNLDKGKGSMTYESSLKGTDGLITNKKDILLTAFYADCVPLYFFDPITEYIGIAHAGWKGTVNRMAERMVGALQQVGVDAKNLLVVIGPCISQSAYEVDNKVIEQIDATVRQNVVIENEKKRFLLDLKQLNVEILLQSGILRHNIDMTKYCTYYDDDLFFSHRRDNGNTGRMLGFIGYKS